MKKIKYIFTFLFLLVFIFSIFNIGKVLASVNTIKIIDAQILEKSDTTDASIVNFNDDKVQTSVVYHKLNDYVTYKITLKNNDSKKYTIKTINNSNTNENIVYEYDRHENEDFIVGEEKEFEIKAIYKNSVTSMDKRVSINSVVFNIIFVDEDGNESSTDIIVNPKTGDNIGIYLVMIIVSLLGLISIAVNKNKKLRGTLLLALILVPLTAKAANLNYEMTFNESINLSDKVLVKLNTNGQVVERVIDYNSKLQEPDPVNRPGYEFVGWYYNNEEFDFNQNITSDITLEAKYNLLTYNIGYTYDGGSAANPITYTVEELPITLTAPTKEGYNFSGWTGSNGDTLQTSVTISTGTTGNLTYVAHYSASPNTKYTVTHKYKNLDNTFVSEDVELTGTTGTTVQAPFKEKYGFDNPEAQNVTIEADGSAKVTYEYERTNFTFAIEDRTGLDSTSTANGSYPYETQITLKANEKDGYTFTKWSDDVTEKERTFKLTENKTLELVYIANQYQVHFDGNANDVIGEMPNQTFTYDVEKTLSKNTFTREGYTFAGWSTNEDGTGNTYTDEESVTNLMTNGTITLYANWTANTNTAYKIIHRYQNVGLTTYTIEEVIEHGTTGTTVQAAVQPRTGFETPSVQNITITGNGNASVTYTYDREQYEFSVTDRTYLTNDSTPNGTYPYGMTITLKAKEKEGYTFSKWSDDNTNAEREITLTGETTLSYEYTANTNTAYTVIHRYQDVGLTTYTTEEVVGYGTTDTTIPAPRQERTGFETPASQNITITGNGEASVTYTYDREQYAFSVEDRTYLTNTSTANGTYPYGKTITLSVVEREGYTFSKWSDDNTNAEREITLTGPLTLSYEYVANTNTTYKVIHRYQDVGLTTYTTEEVTEHGTTGETVKAPRQARTGFETPDEEDVTITPNGQASVTYTYDRIKYTVTFNTDGGTSIQAQQVPYQGKVTKPDNPEKDYYEFVNWYSDSNKTTLFDFANTTITTEKTIYAKYNSIDHCSEFASDSWSTIVSTLKTNNKYYKVGCTKNIEMDLNDDGTNETYALRLVNATTPDECSTNGFSQTACGIVVEFANVVEDRKMRETQNSSSGGWQNTDLVLYLNSTFYDKLPNDLKSVIIPTYPIVSSSGYGQTSPNITQNDSNKNKLYLMSLTEVGFSSPTFDNSQDTSRTLDYYYKYEGRLTKSKSGTPYWLRSASAQDTNKFLNITGSGQLNVNAPANNNLGVSPVFRIGDTQESYTVSFDTDGGSHIANQTVGYRGTVTKPEDPEKDDLIFDKWYADSSFETEFDFTNTKITKNTTIYAKFNVPDHCSEFANDSWETIKNKSLDQTNYYGVGCEKTISFDVDNDGNADTSKIRVANNTTPAECSDDNYSQTACGFVLEFVNLPTSITYFTGVTSTTGGWEASNLRSRLNSVIYNRFPQDLKNVITSTKVISGHEYGADNNYVTEDNLYIISSVELTGATHNDSLTTSQTRQLDYYVEHNTENDRIKYTIGSGNGAKQYFLRSMIEGSTNTVPTITSSGGYQNVGYPSTTYVAPLFHIGNKESYTVTFDTDGGSTVDSQTVYRNDMVEVPTSPTKTGYTFDYWTLNNSQYSFNTLVKGNMTLKAHYTPTEYNITYILNDGVVSGNPDTYDITSDITLNNPTKEGYTFTGWTKDDSEELLTTVNIKNQTGDVTYTAHFEEEGPEIICKRATTLHYQTCTQTNKGCALDGYTGENNTVFFGNIVGQETYKPGDAFDCDVNNNGIIDTDSQTGESTERFYYLRNVNSNTAALLYYSNVVEGSNNNTTSIKYTESSHNYEEPTDLVANLPSKIAWSNVSLTEDEVQVTNELGGLKANGNSLPKIDYSNYSSRMATVEDIKAACDLETIPTAVALDIDTDPNKCGFLFENTTYVNSTAKGYWLATAVSNQSSKTFRITGSSHQLGNTDSNNSTGSGIRPVIEVPLENMEAPLENNTFTVSFDTQGGNNIPLIYVEKNGVIGTLPDDPVKEDYEFKGWFTDTSYTTPVTTETIITGNTVIYAKWLLTNAVVEYNNNGYLTFASALAEVTTSDQVTIKLLKNHSEKVTIPNGKNIVVDLNGYTMTNSGDNQVILNNGIAVVKNGTITTTAGSKAAIDNKTTGTINIEAVTIHANGKRSAAYNEQGTMIIDKGSTFDVNHNLRPTVMNICSSCVLNIKDATITSGTKIAVSNAGGTLTIGAPGETLNDATPILQGGEYGVISNNNVNMYDGVIKGKNGPAYNGTLTNSSNNPVAYTGTATNDIIIAAESGYETEEGTEDNYSILYLDVITGKYLVKYKVNGGEIDRVSDLVDQGSSIEHLPVPTKGIYTFDGWYEDSEFNGSPVTDGYIPTGNIDLYAKWVYNASNEVVSFRTTNDAQKVYYNYIDTWKTSATNFPSWNSSNNANNNWALDATENTAMMQNFNNYNCTCADGQCSTSGTVHCDKPKGYDTGIGQSVSVYTYENNTKGTKVSYAKGSDGIIYNLIPDKVYYWEADSDSDVHGLVKFTGERRIIDAGDVLNVRDLGGLPADSDGDGIVDGTVKYEKLFRGIKLNSADSITELTNLGINSELDLREPNSDANKLSRYNRIEAQNYLIDPNGSTQEETDSYAMTRNAVKYAMEEIVAGKNVYFHCRIGADRTGTVAYILEGLLGVPEEDRVQDYELSFFSGLVRIHRYHDEKPGSNVGTGHERFVYMHNLIQSNSDIYNWYMAGSSNTTTDTKLIEDFRNAMIEK